MMKIKWPALIALSLITTNVSWADTADDVFCTRCVNTRDIAKNAVSAAKIRKDAVTTAKIRDGAVTAAKLAADLEDTLGGLGCADGEVAKFNGNAWVCAADADTLADLVCRQDQIARYDGTQCVCADESPVGPDGPCFRDSVDSNGSGRYFDCGNGTATDTVTGLIMLQKLDCFDRDGQSWASANESAASLGEGQCSLTDGSSPGDWRLMTGEEWKATVALVCVPSLTNRAGNGCFVDDSNPVFSGVEWDFYWSSSTDDSFFRAHAVSVDLSKGLAFVDDKTTLYSVWPVRSGH